MKRLTFLLTLALIYSATLLSQDCLPNGITFTTQAQIDSFQINYPNCTEIEGYVKIYGNKITNLKGLEVITYIGGDFFIDENETMANLIGLNNLDSIGGNLKLLHFSHARNLTGLNNLSYIGGSLSILRNKVENLSGLDKLSSIGGDLYINEPTIKSLEGLQNLSSIGGDLKLEMCQILNDLTKLESLTTIGGDLWLEEAGIYKSLTGFNNLKSIGGNIWIEDLSMVNFKGLDNLTSVGGYIHIEGMDYLTSLIGLDNIDAGSIDSLYIFRNSVLSICEIQSICDYLVIPDGKIVLNDNAPGCNSVEEIESACQSFCLAEGIIFRKQSQIDNFQANYPGCSNIEGNVEIVSVEGTSITNLKGLSNISSVRGNLKIEGNRLLSNLTGLDSLTYIGGNLSIANNYSLYNLSGMDNLTSIGSNLLIQNNENLTHLTGLNNLTYIGADLLINENTNLKSLNELNYLTFVGGNLNIKKNQNLTSLTGLDNVDVYYINSISIHDNSSLSYCEVTSMCNFIGFADGTLDIYNNATGCNNPEDIANSCGVSMSVNIGLLRKESEIKELEIQQSRTLLFGLGALVLIIILGAIIFIRQRKIKAQHALELEQVKSEKLKELDHLKSRFFANISHEFRTPLTLIMGPLEKVLSKTEDDKDKKDLGIAKKYAGKLQILINNLLTISKLESGKLQLFASETDIVKLVRSYLQAFESLAKQKNIRLQFLSDSKEIKTFIDREKFEQILNNLLSNAFKFTEDGGAIEVTVNSQQLTVNSQQSAVNSQQSTVGSQQSAVGSQQSTEDPYGQAWGLKTHTGRLGDSISAAIPTDWAQITISDTGRGISGEHIDHIFDRFYQAEMEDSFYEGTGIGLALSKELVELHHGRIEVESEQGKGSTFTILIPQGKDHLKPEEIASEKSDELASPAFSFAPPDNQVEKVSFPESIPENNDNQSILLIVEDNADMRAYIRGYFEKKFHVIEAIDGTDGYKKTTEHIPDIIISDVMMPNMNGNEFCRKVKTDESTSHIPVILLTARSSKESRIEGLETGADDFITKPFDGDELQVRVENLINQQQRIRKLLEGKIHKSQSNILIDFVDSGITSMDERFLKKVIEIVKEHHTDPEFSTKAFGQAIGLGSIQLNRKIKALTGRTTVSFIRTFRLNHAAELIKNKSATVAEIAYDVGFNNPSYFTECFRVHFGKLPSEFIGNQ